MHVINYPLDFEKNVITALTQPCFIDARGNLYTLCSDGATVLIAGPEAGTYLQFQGAGTSPAFAWAATQERLFVVFNEGAQCFQATLPRACDSIGLPDYRRSIMLVASATSAYLLHNTQDEFYCFAVSTEGISLLTQVNRHIACGAWIENGKLYIYGMHKRVYRTGKYWFGKGEWFSLKYGVGTILQVDLLSGHRHIDSARGTKSALVAAWEREAGEGDDRHVRPWLELWLDSVGTKQGQMLIGAVMDRRQPVFDDTSEQPHGSDFDGIAFYRWQDGKVVLLRALRGVRYIGKMIMPDKTLLYFLKPDAQRDSFKQRYMALTASPDMELPLVSVVFDWNEENVRTTKFKPSYDERIGIIASSSTATRDLAVLERRHLAASDDGINWRFVHQLPDQKA